MRLLTMAELERETGISRSAIHFYVREALLPPPRKTATNKSLYTEAHVELVREIRRLQDEGLRLRVVKEELRPAIESARAEEVDLSKQSESIRKAILEAAAREFAAKGYMRTRVADIIREVGTTPQVFYGYFPTKLELFIECLEVLSEWSIDLTERRVTMEPDTAKHAVLRAFGYLGLREISPDLLRLARAEAMREGGESKRVLYKSYDDLVFTVLPDLAALRESGQGVPFPSDELVAYAFMGILEATVGRWSRDHTFSKREVLETILYLWLAIEAAYAGALEGDSRGKEYQAWVEGLARSPVPVPDGFSAAGGQTEPNRGR
jgi:AcrR family transcriptional regulator/predicted DNA-binding transcriptional regulator AlpA